MASLANEIKRQLPVERQVRLFRLDQTFHKSLSSLQQQREQLLGLQKVHCTEAHALLCRPVVILANRPKLEMDAECNQGLAGMGLDVDTRSGVPFSVSDLEKVAAGTARTVLLLSSSQTTQVSCTEPLLLHKQCAPLRGPEQEAAL